MVEHLIKVFGERNTGTRAALTMLRKVPDVVIGGGFVPETEELARADRLRQTIEAQFRAPWKGLYLDAVRDMECVARGQLGAWKHSLPSYDPDFAERGVRVLFMVRDPYSWALSLFRKPYHRKGPRADSVEAFVEQPWMTERRDYMPCVLESPLELWNEKLRAYLAFRTEAEETGVPVQTVRFEDFIVEPVAEITRVLDTFGIEATGVEPVQNSTKNKAQQLPALQAYYREERWISRISATAAERIANWVDWEVASHFGYMERELTEFPQNALSDDPQGAPVGARVDLEPKSAWSEARKRLAGLARNLRNPAA